MHIAQEPKLELYITCTRTLQHMYCTEHEQYITCTVQIVHFWALYNKVYNASHVHSWVQRYATSWFSLKTFYIPSFILTLFPVCAMQAKKLQKSGKVRASQNSSLRYLLNFCTKKLQIFLYKWRVILPFWGFWNIWWKLLRYFLNTHVRTASQRQVSGLSCDRPKEKNITTWIMQ